MPWAAPSPNNSQEKQALLLWPQGSPKIPSHHDSKRNHDVLNFPTPPWAWSPISHLLTQLRIQLWKEPASQHRPVHHPHYAYLLILLQLFTPAGMPQTHLPIQILPNPQDPPLNAPPLNLPLIYADQFLSWNYSQHTRSVYPYSHSITIHLPQFAQCFIWASSDLLTRQQHRKGGAKTTININHLALF